MGDVIELRARSDFDDLSDELDGIADALLAAATRTAFATSWATWSDQQPIGARVEVSEDALRDCDDERVVCIVSAMDAVRRAADSVRCSRRRRAT